MAENQTPRTFEEAVDLVLAEQRRTMIERQKKYGPENIFGLGLMGVLERVENDKLKRLHHYYDRKVLREKLAAEYVPQEIIDQYLPSRGGDFTDDALEDAFIDAANYTGPIALMLKRGWWGLPMADEAKGACRHTRQHADGGDVWCIDCGAQLGVEPPRRFVAETRKDG